MKITVKELYLDMPLGNKGIELDVYDNRGNRLGDLQLGKAKIIWCKGKTAKANGIKVSWEDLIAWFESRSNK